MDTGLILAIEGVVSICLTAAMFILTRYTSGVDKSVDEVKEAHEETAKTLAELRIEVARDYVTHTDLSDIKQMLRRIEDKLDGKADK